MQQGGLFIFKRGYYHPYPLFLNIFWSNINNIMGNCNNLKMQDEHVKLFLAHTLDKHPALTYQAV